MVGSTSLLRGAPVHAEPATGLPSPQHAESTGTELPAGGTSLGAGPLASVPAFELDLTMHKFEVPKLSLKPLPTVLGLYTPSMFHPAGAMVSPAAPEAPAPPMIEEPAPEVPVKPAPPAAPGVALDSVAPAELVDAPEVPLNDVMPAEPAEAAVPAPVAAAVPEPVSMPDVVVEPTEPSTSAPAPADVTGISAVQEPEETDPSPRALSVEEALGLLASGANVFVIDDRSAESFAKSHIPGAVNIPVREFEDRISEVPTDADAIFVYCDCPEGQSGEWAADILDEAGYENLNFLKTAFWKTWTGPTE